MSEQTQEWSYKQAGEVWQVNAGLETVWIDGPEALVKGIIRDHDDAALLTRALEELVDLRGQYKPEGPLVGWVKRMWEPIDALIAEIERHQQGGEQRHERD